MARQAGWWVKWPAKGNSSSRTVTRCSVIQLCIGKVESGARLTGHGGRFSAVTEHQDVIADLEAAGVLAGVRWAYTSATARTLEDYSEAAGHDAAWLGNTRFTLFRDRLDRIFACGRYVLKPGSDATVSLDLLRAELSKLDIGTMPQLAPDLVHRSDLNGSPGWACQGRRFLLASCAFGKLDQLPWPQRSPTKQRVARQRNPEPAQASLFDDLADEEVAGLFTAVAEVQSLDLETFVIGHSLDPVSQEVELVFGRPRLNNGGGEAWHWYQNLLTLPPTDGRRRFDEIPTLPSPDTVPDAPVRLRRPASEQARDQVGGDQ